MKKLVLAIIGVSIIFSSSGNTFAGQGAVEKILDLEFAVEQIEYTLSSLPNKSFTNPKVQAKYNSLRAINKVLTTEFYKKYKSGKIDYYSAKGIVKNHQNFIYHTIKLFEYIPLKFQNPHYADINGSIKESYSQMRMSFKRIKFLYNRTK